ncbi:MAG TPA: NAD(P)/FAD-dependent oxidoreductase [Trichocoleus sp.]
MVLELDPVDVFSRNGSAGPACPHICILGGGFGGLYTALALHQRLKRQVGVRHSAAYRITLVEPHDRFTFTPLLYELVTAELRPWQVAPTYRELLSGTKVHLHKDWVESLSLSHRRIYLRHGEPLTYDYLVVAMGSRQRTFAVPGVKTHAYPFANLEDAERLSRRLKALEQLPQPLIRIAVVGGGPSGIELACKLADRLGQRGQIHLLDRRSAILRAYPAGVRAAALAAIRDRRIVVHLETAVEGIEAGQIHYRQKAPQVLAVDLVVWAVGASPHHWPSVEAVPTSELGQCHVCPTLQLPNHPEVFVLGDMAAMPAASSTASKVAPLTAQAAFQAAPVVAHNVAALVLKDQSLTPAGRPLRAFAYHHLGNMLTLGQGNAVVCGCGLTLTGRLGAFARRWAYWLRLPTWPHRWRFLMGYLRPGNVRRAWAKSRRR